MNPYTQYSAATARNQQKAKSLRPHFYRDWNQQGPLCFKLGLSSVMAADRGAIRNLVVIVVRQAPDVLCRLRYSPTFMQPRQYRG